MFGSPGSMLRGGAAGNPYRWVGTLALLRPDLDSLEVVVPTVMAEALAAPGLEHDLKAFEHSLLRVAVRDAQRLVVVDRKAAADAELEAAARHQVHHSHLLSHLQ